MRDKTFISVVFIFLLHPAYTQVKVQDLRCEMLTDPLGIDVKEPGLSWQIVSDQRNVQQISYQILVASSKEMLNKNEPDVWNSGKQNSSQSIHVKYAGNPLESGKKYFWKVKVITNKGETTTATAYFSMGLLNENDWKAKWIGYDKTSPWDSITQWSRLSARYLRKEFQQSGIVKRATAYVCGLGLHELFINGKKIGDQVLSPSPTDYRKSVLYNTYDVTNNIKNGSNAIGVVLGNGRFFTMRQNYKTQKHNTFGYPKLLMQLEIEYTDGKKKIIVTDDSWKVNVDGPIRTNNEYDGEEYDATKELMGWNSVNYDDRNWTYSEIVDQPEGKLIAQMQAPMKVMQKIKPVAIKEVNGKYILDMGQNFSGWLQIKVNGKKGNRLQLRFAESLQSSGELYIANLRDAKVTDVYIVKGTGVETWHPTFVYHGFRYVEITGWPGTPSLNDFEGQMIYDDLSNTGSFYSSDKTINSIHKNAWWGIASNYKGMPIDCPQRNERQPWLGDRAQGAYGESFLFNNANLYAKWLNDIEQSQTEEGAIPDVAPAFWNYYSDNVTWPGTYILVAEMLYKQYGDMNSIVKHYPSMKKWMSYMKDKYMKDFIVTKDKYGDWCVPPESLELIRSRDSMRTTDGELLATATYYHLLSIMKKFALLSNNDGDVNSYDEMMQNIQIAFNKKFYNPQTKTYDNNTVTANLLPLYFGITPEKEREAVFNNIYNKIKIENHMHISTGVIGTQWLMRGLSEFDHPDIAYTLASNKTYPSWGYMVEQGATTIWELWNGNTADPQMNSQNHVMLLGDLLIWLYENAAGIRSDEQDVAFKRIIMKPEQIDGLNFVNATYRSLYGEIKSNWKRTIDAFDWDISVPANTTAIIYLPADELKNIRESDKHLHREIKFLRMEGKYAVLEIGSGNYQFHSMFNFRKGIVRNEFIFNRASFPESHASTIAETPGGLVAAWFGGTKEGNKDVCIWTSRLVNNIWTEPAKVADGVINDSVRYACYNPVLFYTTQKELLLFYKIGPNVAGWTGWMMRSKDDGITWSKREALPGGFLGPIKNKPELINGVLLCPSSTEKNGWKAHIEYTTDFGKTWTKSEDINDGKTIQAIQPSILKYSDGRLQILCRSRNTTINESWSNDGGKTWSEMKASGLPNNNSGTDAVTLKDGRQLLVYNHALPTSSWVNGKGPRTPLNITVSYDGRKWFAAAILEDSPISQYSYPSVIQTKDGLVHIVYTWRRERIKHVVIDPLKLELKEIVNEKWPGMRNMVNKPSDD